MKYKELVPVVNEILSQYDFPLTVRQIYYRLISDPYNLFPNTRSYYKSFDRMLVKAREEEKIDEDKIEDRTRQVIGGEEDVSNKTPEEYLQNRLSRLSNSWVWYDLKMWTSQEDQLEVWVEKDALAEVVNRAANPYRVTVFPSRGFSSYTKIKEGLKRFRKYTLPDNKFAYILHLADHDPSGLIMTQDLITRLTKYGGSFISVKRIGLNINQVREFNLRPNPVKIADSRAAEYIREYGKDCWELDALPPDELQRIITKKIEEFIDKKAWTERKQEIDEGQEKVKMNLKEIMKLIRGEE